MTHILIEQMIEQAEAHREYNTQVEAFSKVDSHDDLAELFQSIAGMSDGEVYHSYSGRGMYGDQCWGVTGDAFKIIEVAAMHGLFHAKVDSMGHNSSIVYWPRIAYTGEAPTESDED
jgi:hypothetical protein